MLSLPAIRVVQPIGEFFIASMPAEVLVAISYADVRRLVDEQRDVERYLGIQRPLSKKRIREISTYITSMDATFPTSVILAVDERCAEYDDEERMLTLYPYNPDDADSEDAIEPGRMAKVLDGQHRIAGFMDEDDQYRFKELDVQFEINVAVFIGADIPEQASIFATVNLAQTKVNRSLVYDLTELAKTKSPYKTCHNVAVALDETKSSPLFERIKRLGVATKGRSNEPLTQAAFVESLVKFISTDPLGDRNALLEGRKLHLASEGTLMSLPFRNLFIEGKEVDISEILFNYFKSIERKWPVAWKATNVKGNLLPRSNAFKAFMRYLLKDVYIKAVSRDFGKVPSVRTFAKYFEHVAITDSDFTTKHFVPGSGGQAKFYKVLTGDIHRNDFIDD